VPLPRCSPSLYAQCGLVVSGPPQSVSPHSSLTSILSQPVHLLPRSLCSSISFTRHSHSLPTVLCLSPPHRIALSREKERVVSNKQQDRAFHRPQSLTVVKTFAAKAISSLQLVSATLPPSSYFEHRYWTRQLIFPTRSFPYFTRLHHLGNRTRKNKPLPSSLLDRQDFPLDFITLRATSEGELIRT
jgi:hypothetical protein